MLSPQGPSNHEPGFHSHLGVLFWFEGSFRVLVSGLGFKVEGLGFCHECGDSEIQAGMCKPVQKRASGSGLLEDALIQVLYSFGL